LADDGGAHDVFGRLLPDAQAPGRARGLVRDLCTDAGIGGGVLDLIVLLTSEAVTNAVLHGRGHVQVRAHSADGRVRVEVADRSRRTPAPAPNDDHSEGGRGLLLLERSASDWGVDVRRRGKTVWFEVVAG
jgi:anti-sigma regulatory factor (Ser/Thr protein kinase)